MTTLRKSPWFAFLIVMFPVVSLAWWIWLALWGFGGVYTHIRYVPTPDNLIEDTAFTVFDFDAGNPALRVYRVEMTLDRLIQFYEEHLPEAGWVITRAGYVTLTRGEQIYCMVAEQRRVTAYISIRQGLEPPIRSGVRISLHKAEPSYCHFETLE